MINVLLQSTGLTWTGPYVPLPQLCTSPDNQINKQSVNPPPTQTTGTMNMNVRLELGSDLKGQFHPIVELIFGVVE